MKKSHLILSIFLLLATFTWAQQRIVKLKLVQTSDVHGNYFPYDFILRQDATGSLSRVCSYVRQERKVYNDRLILLDNGDILQGQPTAYYYNYIDTTATHLCAAMMNFMDYDAGNMGNHDIETGRAVFDRWASDCDFPILGANIIETATEQPHFKPYIILERDGIKIAILGMITPAIPAWLSENLWRGLRFDDMEETARHWMTVIREQEKPDLVIGIFHAGRNAYVMNGKYNENASVDIARHIPGFDIVMMGHDHALACEKVINAEGDSVLIIKEFVSKRIGRFTESISTRPAYFGPSAFIDLIHQLQLAISGADISLAAPLSFDAEIKAGDIFVNDMFSLYKYENMLYTMSLSGKEIRGALEMSYALWTNRMKSADDPLLLLRTQPREGAAVDRAVFQNPSYNFDSAAGILYTVDVTKPEGEKVYILSMADGTPFDETKMYKVAVNSYRGNGGGELLTKGAGIPQDELEKRILSSTDKDLRYYLMKYIEQQQTISPKALNQWRFIPETWTKTASQRDYNKLFGNEKQP